MNRPVTLSEHIISTGPESVMHDRVTTVRMDAHGIERHTYEDHPEYGLNLAHPTVNLFHVGPNGAQRVLTYHSNPTDWYATYYEHAPRV